MISKLEERGNCAYIVEDGIARIIPLDEYIIKLQELDNQNKIMEEETITPAEESVETPEIAPEEESVEETTDVPADEKNSVVEEDNAPVGEDTPVEEAPAE